MTRYFIFENGADYSDFSVAYVRSGESIGDTIKTAELCGYPILVAVFQGAPSVLDENSWGDFGTFVAEHARNVRYVATPKGGADLGLPSPELLSAPLVLLEVLTRWEEQVRDSNLSLVLRDGATKPEWATAWQRSADLASARATAIRAEIARRAASATPDPNP